MQSTSDLKRLAQHVLNAAGADKNEAAIVADILLWGDKVGRPNQGIWRLPILCERLEKGLYNSPCNINIDMTKPCLAIANADAGLGHYVAYQVMEEAIAVAGAEGICAIATRNSNFYGAGGYYAAMAAKRGLVGIALSNSFPKVAAHNGRDAVLGTNPFAFACPTNSEDEPLVVDMSTSSVAGSTLRKANENATALPESTYANSASEPGAKQVLAPFGEAKGFGLALVVEVLAGILSGAGFSHQVKSMYENFTEPGNNGHFFLAIDINQLMPIEQFQARMQTLTDWLQQSGTDVRYPGQARWHCLQTATQKGVYISRSTYQALQDLAKKYALAFDYSLLVDES